MPPRSALRSARHLYAVFAVLGLAGCVAPSGPPQVRPVSQVARPRSATLDPTGLEAVMGRSAQELQRLFGKPRLDVIEGDARKLQFGNGQCVLDAYLYPEGPRQSQIVTYLDARRPDGQAVDRTACIGALSR